MKRHEAWRAAYRADRYLRDAPLAAIERRSQDIACNMLGVNDEGKLTAGEFRNNLFWWIQWTHILEELALRNTPYGSVKLMEPGSLSWVSYPERPRGLRILGKKTVGIHDLVRVGQREHIKDAMNKGRFRIAPAASYADPSLNPAINDDELSVTAVRSGQGATIRPYDPKTGRHRDAIPTIGEIVYSRKMNENFYVICLTAGYSPRLLDDFQADAMLVISNVDRFILRIQRAVKKVRPDLEITGNAVTYYDPYRVKPNDIDPFFAKNFRYAYQKEYRMVWYAPNLPMSSEPFFVDIGSMRDIASIHVLRD